jgi:hypothetical protein
MGDYYAVLSWRDFNEIIDKFPQYAAWENQFSYSCPPVGDKSPTTNALNRRLIERYEYDKKQFLNTFYRRELPYVESSYAC